MLAECLIRAPHVLGEILFGVGSYLRQRFTPQLSSDRNNMVGIFSLCIFLYLSVMNVSIYYYIYCVDDEIFQ